MTEKNDARDLYCLLCGYNLRGLGGDPRRCPECGHLNSVAELEVPAQAIARELRQLQTGPALCGAALVVLATWLGPLVLVALVWRGPPRATIWWFLAIVGAAAVVAWIVGLAIFRASCRGRVGWLAALLTFNLYALLISVTFIVSLLAVLASVGILPLGNTFLVNLSVPIRAILMLAVALLGLFVAIPWLYRRAKACIAPLQREAAARMARKRSCDA